MSDLINRQDAIDELREMPCKSDEDGYVWIIRSDAWAKIDNLPSEQRWIPCSERLPKKKSDWKNVTVLDESGDTRFTYSSVGFYLSDGCWIVDNEPMEDNSSIRVIAWMPLPAPYKESEVES